MTMSAVYLDKQFLAEILLAALQPVGGLEPISLPVPFLAGSIFQCCPLAFAPADEGQTIRRGITGQGGSRCAAARLALIAIGRRHPIDGAVSPFHRRYRGALAGAGVPPECPFLVLHAIHANKLITPRLKLRFATCTARAPTRSSMSAGGCACVPCVVANTKVVPRTALNSRTAILPNPRCHCLSLLRCSTKSCN